MAHVLVIGQTANDLLEKGYRVTVLAKHWPGDDSIEYTSPWAGAIWNTRAKPNQVEACDWMKQSYKRWVDILKNDAEESEKMGIQLVPISNYSIDEEDVLPSPRPWFSEFVQDFAIIPTSELSPGGPKSGWSFKTILINPEKYLTYLHARAKSLGVKAITASLPASTSIATTIAAALGHLHGESVALVVNCTGLGAGKLCDEDVFPIRGQTLVVRITPAPPTPRIMTLNSIPVTHIVPRPITPFGSEPCNATYYIGGTNDKDDWDSKPTPEISQGILDRVKGLMAGWASDDAKIEVLKEQVGLRPGRKGGWRVEIEEVNVEGDTGKISVVHQYGHAGDGFAHSIGSARKAVCLMDEVLTKSVPS